MLVPAQILQEHFHPLQFGLFIEFVVKLADSGMQVFAKIHKFPNLFTATAHGLVLLLNENRL
jgi:hypothetical protein